MQAGSCHEEATTKRTRSCRLSSRRSAHKASREIDVAPAAAQAPPPARPSPALGSFSRRLRPFPISIGRLAAARHDRRRARPAIGRSPPVGGVSRSRPALCSARWGARGGGGGAWQVRRARGGGGGPSPAQPRPPAARPPGLTPAPA